VGAVTAPVTAAGAVTSADRVTSADPGAAAVAADAGPRMPDFVRPRRGARHTVDTALRALRALGVDDARVVVESAGAGWEPNAVVRQHPPPGAPLGDRARVTLGVSGVGALEALPYALRDVDESAFGVDPLLALFDSPVHKLRHHLRGGGEFFALRAGDPVTARRWIEQVFQVDASAWAPARWPAVARLLPALHRVAGREEGLRLALDLVFGLRLAAVALERVVVPAAAGERCALGTAASRLGVDALLGAGRAEVARLVLTLGPVPLGVYLDHQGVAAAAERRALYALVASVALATSVRERWVVGDPGTPARLGGAPAWAAGRSAPAPATLAVGAPAAGAPAAAAPAALGLTTRLG
jgi:hypothetical protein